MALAADDLAIAQRCAAAVGDIATSKYLGEVHDVKCKAEEQMGKNSLIVHLAEHAPTQPHTVLARFGLTLLTLNPPFFSKLLFCV